MKPYLLILVLALSSQACAAELRYKERFLQVLVERVPGLLKTYDPATGHFGQGVWICSDQNVMLPLAVVYSTPGEGNRYHRDRELLEAIMKAGDALIDDADDQGRWVFRKKDNSTWGMIHMPWTYSRWIRTYALIRDDMPAARRERWARALTLGYENIARSQLGNIHNIPAHHAMGLYVAGKALDRPEWCEQAAAFLHRVAAAQAESGYWSEGQGPVVNYNFVYVEALGTYYLMSGDRTVLPAIERAIRFHAAFTYPGGQAVETIDQRNPYHDRLLPGNPAFTITPAGRAWLHNQWRRNNGSPPGVDGLALFVLHGQEGPFDSTAAQQSDTFILTDGGVERVAIIRDGPWFVCLSAYTTPVSTSRWHQDRQNFVSIWHDNLGLILGGGNTKLQPAWSNFTVGDMSLLAHTPGDEQPNFLPRGELYHVPSAATLVREPVPGLDLTYGPESCTLRVRIQDAATLVLELKATLASGRPVLAHLTLLPHLGKTLSTSGGYEGRLSEDPLELPPDRLGGGLSLAGYRLVLPGTSSLHWPALPHNPYRKDGRATPEEGRIEIRIPFDTDHTHHRVTLHVDGEK